MAVTVCMQCVATAITVGAGATGLRAFLVARRPRWLTPSRFRFATAALLTAGVLAAGISV